MNSNCNVYRLSIKINGFAELGEYLGSIPVFSKNNICLSIEDLMIQLESCKEQFYIQNEFKNRLDNKEILDIIDFPPYYIELRKDGIYRITQKRGNSKQIFEGRFQFISYDNEIFIIMRNEVVYSGSFSEIMRQLSPFRYSGSYDCLKKVFNYYSKSFKKINKYEVS